jgi:hypothetical protein
MMNEEYPYPLFSPDGRVVCQICGKPFLVLSPTHLKTHNIKYADYFKRYPNAARTSEIFDVRSGRGKSRSGLFEEQEEKSMLGEELIIDEEVEIDEFPMQKELERVVANSPMERTKNKILDHLRLFYANIEMDYIIRQFVGETKTLRFEYVTDFCDPVLKVVVQFPGTFWHNREPHAIDSVKRTKMEQFGWKVIEIHGNNPALEKIGSVLRDTF